MEEYWNKIPSCETLKSVFEKVIDAFELVNENGPAFMQDFKLPEDCEESKIRSLLIDAPGENGIKKNQDHFAKRDAVNGLCPKCTATALFTLQVNAPAGGQGNRTGLRGGGPLTTLILPEENFSALWKKLWLNVISYNEFFNENASKATMNIFPWMGPTYTSENRKKSILKMYMHYKCIAGYASKNTFKNVQGRYL